MGSKDWLQKNFGDFSDYADLEDLQKLNVNFSSVSPIEVFLIVHMYLPVTFWPEQAS